jgi:RimJ/RimL family protein N-acetyltransferase
MPSLEPATADDIDAVMRLERLPGNEMLVGRFERAQHEAEMALPDSRYFVWRDDDGAVLAFAILQRMTNPSLGVRLRRIIAAEPGRGTARAFLPALMDWLFETTKTHRLDLHVYTYNERAWRAYEREGFTKEGVRREVSLGPDGKFHSQFEMSILRPEWEALPRRAHFSNTSSPGSSRGPMNTKLGG